MSKKDRKRIALITGASSGLGRCFVRQIGERYPSLQEIWVIARRRERLESLRKELAFKTPGIKLRILELDLSEQTSFAVLSACFREECPRLRLLVNAAGLGHAGRIGEQQLDKICEIIDVNCRALMAVTRICLPYLEKGSRVIELASGSAFAPQPGFAAYAASKACVLSFSRALQEELRPLGILVTAVCPGPVRTEFFRAGGISLSPVKKKFLADPEQVVRRALSDSAKGRALSVYGFSMRLFYLAAGVLPQGFIVRASSLVLLKK